MGLTRQLKPGAARRRDEARSYMNDVRRVVTKLLARSLTRTSVRSSFPRNHRSVWKLFEALFTTLDICAQRRFATNMVHVSDEHAWDHLGFDLPCRIDRLGAARRLQFADQETLQGKR